MQKTSEMQKTKYLKVKQEAMRKAQPVLDGFSLPFEALCILCLGESKLLKYCFVNYVGLAKMFTKVFGSVRLNNGIFVCLERVCYKRAVRSLCRLRKCLQ